MYPHRNPVCNSSLTHTCYMPHPLDLYWFDHPNDIWWAVQIMKLLIIQFPDLHLYIFLRSYFSLHPQPVFLPHSERPSFFVFFYSIVNSRFDVHSTPPPLSLPPFATYLAKVPEYIKVAVVPRSKHWSVRYKNQPFGTVTVAFLFLVSSALRFILNYAY
jgi:hypothetical protein